MTRLRLFCVPALAMVAALSACASVPMPARTSPVPPAPDPTFAVSRTGATVERLTLRYEVARDLGAYLLPLLPPARAAQLRALDRAVTSALAIARTAATLADRRAALDRAEAAVAELEAG